MTEDFWMLGTSYEKTNPYKMHHPGPPRQIQQDNLTQNWKNQFIAQVLAPDAQTCRDKILQLLRLHCTYRLSPSIFWSNPLWKSGPLDSLHSLVVLFPELLQVVFQGPGTPEKAMILGPVVTQVYISTTEVFRSHANALSIIVKHLKTSPKLFRTYRLLPNIVFFFSDMPSVCCQLSFLERRRTTSAFFRYWESIPWEPHLRKNVRRQSRGHIWPSDLIQARKRHIHGTEHRGWNLNIQVYTYMSANELHISI
jgi:hypothetical protein